MRCPTCNRFTPYDVDQEPEEQDEPTLDRDGNFSMTLRRVLPCAECGTELKEGELTVEASLEIPDSCEPTDDPADDGKHAWSFDLTYEPTMRSESGRRARTFYGVEVTGTVTCIRCHTEVQLTAHEELQASSFDESC